MKVLGFFLFALLFAAGDEPAPQDAVEATFVVEFHDQRLSIRAAQAPLTDLLAEIETKSGIVIELRDQRAAANQVTVAFENLTPERALEEILRGLNFAYFYSGARLARVVVLPQGGIRTTPPPGPVAPGRIQGQIPRQQGAPPAAQPAQKKPEAQASEEKRVAERLERIDALEESDDPKSIAALGEMLTDPSSEVKEAALSALADKKGATVTQLIRQGLNDKDPEFRISVLEVLADRNDLDSLRKAKSDPNEDVRERAADLLENATP